METLQPALRIKIFSCLNMNDLLRCSLVSSEWRSFVLNNIEISSLSCKEKVGFFHEMRYSFSFESIEEDCFLLADCLKFLRSTWVQTMLQKSLKKLYIHHPIGYIYEDKKFPSLVSTLNLFVQLEQLQICALKVASRGEKLNLPNLVCLTVAHFFSYGRLKLETPKLTCFSTGQHTGLLKRHSGRLSNFRFKYESKISKLDVNEYEERLMNFVNLEILYCRHFPKQKVISVKDFVHTLSRLRELHCQYIGATSVSRLLSAKCKLRRTDFNFYFCGFHINTNLDLDEYLSETEQDQLEWSTCGWKIMLANQNRLSPHIKYTRESYCYDELVFYFEQTSFASFFNRIVQIEKVELKQPINDEPKLVEFLKACKHIGGLLIKDISLSQQLFDRLFVYQPFITHLAIYDGDELDLDFIFQLSYLSSFTTDQKVSLDFVSEAFEKLKLLRSFRVCGENVRFKIGRDSIVQEVEKNIKNSFRFDGQMQMLTVLRDLFNCLT